MANSIADEKDKTLNFLDEQKKDCLEKKPLKEVLSSYLEKNQDLKKVKKDFSDLKLDLKKSQTSYETLAEIQKKLSLAYNKVSNKIEKQKTKKNS